MKKLAIHPTTAVGGYSIYQFVLSCALLFSIFLSSEKAHGQQLQMSDFVLYAGPGGSGCSTPGGSGYGVFMGSSNAVNNGAIGSTILMQSTGSAGITSNIHSQRKVILAKNNTVSGKITAANATSLSGTIVSVGTSANLSGDIDSKGNVVVSSGVVNSKVTHPVGTTYSDQRLLVEILAAFQHYLYSPHNRP